MVGINEPVRVYDLMDTMEAADKERIKLVEVFHQALDCFENHKWKEALEGFEESFSMENGGPSELYLKRCKTYMSNPPADDWDGVFSLTEK